MKLGANTRPRQPQVSQLDAFDHPPRRFQKRLDWKPIVFVIVLSFLILDGRPQPDRSGERLHEMDAETVSRRIRHWVDEVIDDAAFRRRQFRVFAAARINRESFAAQQT